MLAEGLDTDEQMIAAVRVIFTRSDVDGVLQGTFGMRQGLAQGEAFGGKFFEVGAGLDMEAGKAGGKGIRETKRLALDGHHVPVLRSAFEGKGVVSGEVAGNEGVSREAGYNS